MSNPPVQDLFVAGAEVDKGESARMTVFVGALAITDLIKTTLGPKGMDKILQSMGTEQSFQVTNDGATILGALHVDNPAAKILIDISKTQDQEVGDGTTSVCVLAGELLREAEKLVNKHVHPQTIIHGWRKASKVALEALGAAAKDNRSSEEQFRKDLFNIACTTLSSKILAHDKEHFANLAVDAILRLKVSDLSPTSLDSIKIIKKTGGVLKDSFLDEGFLLEKSIGVGQPKRLENPKILVANTPMDTDKIKIFGAKVKVDSTAKLAEIEEAERSRMLEKCQKISNHGINCFINRQLIYNLPEQFFTDKGIMAIEHADFDGVERLALVLGAEIASTFDDPERVQLGQCDLIEEVMVGEDKMIKFSGCHRGEACTIVLRGATKHMLDEADRSLHDALCVLFTTVKDSKVVLGGGCSEMIMAKAVDNAAAATDGKEALAIEAFARALRQIPIVLADNAGYDSADLVTRLRAAHHNNSNTSGLDMTKADIGDMEELGITESFRVKSQVLISASEAAEMILRVDDIVKAPPRPRENDPRYR